MRGTSSVQDVEAVGFQRWEWAVERVWWAVLAGLLVISLLGVFGSGAVSETTVGGRDAGVRLEYERFARNGGIANWFFAVEPSAVRGNTATIVIGDDLAGAMQVQNISPAPSTETSTREGIVYEFAVPRAESPPVVRLTFRVNAVGLREGVVRAGEHDGVSVWLFAYP